MHIQCPKCSADLELTVEVLSAAEGLIRCGECDTAFNALALIPDPARQQGEPGGEKSSAQAPQRAPVRRKKKPPPAPPERSPDRPEPAASEPAERDALPMDDLFEGAQHTLHPGDGPPLQIGAEEEITRSGHWWVVATLVLVVTLGFQLVIASTGALARNPGTRPIAEFICSVFACEMPQTQNLQAISLLNRDIRKHPSVEGGLMITATMSNQHSHSQPYPMVEIQLADLNGKPVALRRFEPREYLAADTDIEAGMPIDVLVPMSFEVLDPGESAVAFEFSFR